MKKLCLFMLLAFSLINASAQIKIGFTNVEDWVKANFVGQGVVLGNITTKLAGKEAIGTFTSNNVLKIKDGLVISTGDIRSIPGLNDKYNQSTSFNNSGKSEFDKELKKIVKGNLFDVSYIEFDFVPYNNSIQFNYQFGSDEYPEYVGSAFNDIFAFFVSKDSGEVKNIALVPQKDLPVSINTINHYTDSSYYIDNNVFVLQSKNRYTPKTEYGVDAYQRTFFGKILYSIKKFFTPKEENQPIQPPSIQPSDQLIKLVDKNLYKNLQFDGITKKLVAQTYVEPYQKYHLKIIISDVSDAFYDSAVFLEKGSLSTKKDTLQPGFKDYPNLVGQIDPKRILAGERIGKLEIIDNAASPDQKSLSIQNVPIVYFDFNQADIKKSEMEKIMKISQLYNENKNQYDLLIIGHTDSKGNLVYNMNLSNRRSTAVAECLKSITPSLKNTDILNKAYLNPAQSNNSDEGRAQNRRVEIKFIKKK